jgi:predicted transcriptional regulator of viral defense system
MLKQKINLGSMEISLLSGLEHDKKTVFTFLDALERLSNTKRQVVRNVLSRLATKGRIKRIKKGTYLLVPFRFRDYGQHEFSLLPVLAKEYYVSFWSALHFWSLTEQLPRTIYAATKKTVKDREFDEVKYRFVKLSGRYFFGFEEAEIQGIKINIASKEKTVLDCLLHTEHCGGIGEVAKALRDYWKDLDWNRLKQYLKKMKNSAVERRLLYILSYLSLRKPLSLFEKKKFIGFRKLDPSAEGRGRYDKKFGLMINVDLREEML